MSESGELRKAIQNRNSSKGFPNEQTPQKRATRSGGSFGLLWFQLTVISTYFIFPAGCHRRRGANRIVYARGSPAHGQRYFLNSRPGRCQLAFDRALGA